MSHHAQRSCSLLRTISSSPPSYLYFFLESCSQKWNPSQNACLEIVSSALNVIHEKTFVAMIHLIGRHFLFVEDCTGCCVKMVQDIGTEKEFVRRTCTNYIEINLFIVDHVCMKEKRGKGKACYCETNECNGTIKYLRPNEGLLPLSLLFLTLVSAISSNLISSFSSYPPTIAALSSAQQCSASLKRTCTTKIRINFFMVGHVCMSESNNRGHMCFCEADLCNGGDSFQKGISPGLSSYYLLFLLLFLIQCDLLYPNPVVTWTTTLR
ncbi:unnamed protein product [Lepeophtheirus salmonis]|uniref:(salmon louse) hypothetical protein n=1 Tax=Lepeophtheirus salmonis TaxID=72036 RepID=A0A7R8CXX1_LEPSM|nr:unnamed protein product [Lepeophtheirus salmonis]CAF2965338.1 unnamed protein product [Lepeophtheirus salmonis]